MVNVAEAAEVIGELTLLKFFPADKLARTALVRLVCEMAESDEQVRWLVHRMLKLYSEWPGIREMRACFCSKFRPKDGISAFSTVYLDGIPSERAAIAPQLPAAASRMLSAPSAPITDEKVQHGVNALVGRSQKMPKGRPIGDRAEAQFREAVTAPRDRAELPGPTPQIITQRDVDRAVEELHAKVKADA